MVNKVTFVGFRAIAPSGSAPGPSFNYSWSVQQSSFLT